MTEMRKFSKYDYDGYAGVEGLNPLIGELSINDTDGYIVVVDDVVIEVDKVMLGGIGNKTWIVADLPRKVAEYIATTLTVDNIESVMDQLDAEVTVEN